MQGFRAKFRVASLVIICIWIGLAAVYDLVKPISNGCIMTYMYTQYVPISSPANVSSARYGLYLYHEGWKKIDYDEHIKKLSGVPVLFIPGNGGSYKQVRSLAAESDRAYQGGPLERTFYQQASLTLQEGGVSMDAASFGLPSHYISMLDWFAVDLEGEHSAMDGQILKEHTEYVVYAIHRTVSGRPPPAASMAVGQFFNQEEGDLELSPQLLLLSTYSPKDVTLKEDHPLAFNMSFTISWVVLDCLVDQTQEGKQLMPLTYKLDKIYGQSWKLLSDMRQKAKK